MKEKEKQMPQIDELIKIVAVAVIGIVAAVIHGLIDHRLGIPWIPGKWQHISHLVVCYVAGMVLLYMAVYFTAIWRPFPDLRAFSATILTTLATLLVVIIADKILGVSLVNHFDRKSVIHFSLAYLVGFITATTYLLLFR